MPGAQLYCSVQISYLVFYQARTNIMYVAQILLPGIGRRQQYIFSQPDKTSRRHLRAAVKGLRWFYIKTNAGNNFLAQGGKEPQG